MSESLRAFAAALEGRCRVKAAMLLRRLRDMAYARRGAVYEAREQAGFRDINCRPEIHKVPFPTAEAYLDFQQGWWTMQLEMAEMGSERRTAFVNEVIHALRALEGPDGLPVKWEVNYFTGVK